MPALVTYSDFLKATKVAKITGPEEILNEATKRTYLFSEMLRGKGPDEILQAGQSIKDTIQLTDAGTFQFYSPNPEFNPTDDDILTDTTLGWRFCVTNYGFSDETIELNNGSSVDVYVRLKKKYAQGQKTDMWNGMENALWATPDSASMEDGTGDNPPFFSIPALVNESDTYAWPGFTTLHGVNFTNEERWRVQRATYNSLNKAGEEDGILPAFDDMWLKVKFESPDGASEYWENDRLRQMKIFTNRDGIKTYKRLLRGGNDNFISPQDPAYNSPVYAGIPLKYIEKLDTATLEISGSTATGNAYPAGKPRYLWLNMQYLVPVFHAKAYMQQVGPIPGGINSPFSHAVYHRNWLNIFCRSRQRQGIVYPA